MKPLRIGLIGYGFMGRTHSNADRKVNNFFQLEHQCVLQAVCARDAAKAQEFADRWGYKSIETDWKQLIARDDIDEMKQSEKSMMPEDQLRPFSKHEVRSLVAYLQSPGQTPLSSRH